MKYECFIIEIRGMYMEEFVALDIETYCPENELTLEEYQYLKNRKDYKSEDHFQRELSTNPYVSVVVSFALFFLGENRAEVYYIGDGKEENHVEEEGISVIYRSTPMSFGLVPAERTLLETLWEKLGNLKRLVTFNGKGFDLEFIRIRSIIHNLKPQAYYLYFHSKSVNHIDLMEVLRVNRESYSLSFIAKRLGIELSKGGMDGSKVKEAFQKGEYRRVAKYNAKDAIITGMVFQRVKDYLKELHIMRVLEEKGLTDAKKLIELGIEKNLLTVRDASNLIDILKNRNATPKQKEYISDILKDYEPELYEIALALSYDTIMNIVNSTLEDDPIT
ncbi:MAG: ribonuclease H-like domain-containing protein [Aquificaceae bacterium]|nr:ribonuclease H-like domain-containing protein [Aquificaceae bacterium]